MIRVGLGYDLHRLIEGRKLFLGGVEFDSPLEDVFDFATRVKSKNVRIVKNWF